MKIAYIYISNCAPCKIFGSIIDELITEGFPISKIEHRVAVNHHKIDQPTPSIVVAEGDDLTKPIIIYPRDLLIGLHFVHQYYPDIVKTESLKDSIKTILNKHLTNDK